MRRLLAGGTQLRPFPPEVMAACYKASQELFAETSAKNENFKKVYESYSTYQKDQYLWWQVTELTFDAFMASQINK